MGKISTKGYEKHFDDKTFLGKCKTIAKKAGRPVISKGLELFYAFPDAPLWAKGTIAASLGYLIFPADVVPDILPVLGFTDDVGVLSVAVGAVHSTIDDKVRGKAEETLVSWGM